MSFHRLFNIILLLALIPTIAVSSMLTYRRSQSQQSLMGLSVLKFY